MDKQDILARLRENEAALKARGVSHAALFGSRARGDQRPDSDIDILIDLAPETLSACGNIPVSKPISPTCSMDPLTWLAAKR
jgi:predicted nucleotidyltransferase